MIHEINEIVKSISPEEIINNMKNIKPDEVVMRISSNYNQIEAAIRNYPHIRSKTLRLGRIFKVKCHNRIKKLKVSRCYRL